MEFQFFANLLVFMSSETLSTLDYSFTTAVVFRVADYIQSGFI